MELRELRYFVVLAEELHFGRAAERLHLAQPSLSQAIQRLEAELRVPLFDRDRRHVELTAAARAVLDRARELLAAAAELPTVARAAHGSIGGVVVISYVDYARAAAMPALLTALRRRCPDALVTTRAAGSSPEALRSVRSGRSDAAILRTPIEPSLGLRKIRLLREPFALAVPAGHRLAGKPRIALADVANEPFATFSRELNPGGFDLVATAFTKAAGRSMVVGQENTRMDDSLMFVASGAGLGLFPASVAATPHAAVTFHEIEPPAPTIEVVLAWDAANTNPLLPGIQAAARSAAAALRKEAVRSGSG